MGTEDTAPAAARVWARLPPAARAILEQELSPTDLQTLMLDLARTRASRVEAADVIRRWRSDRFVQPSPVDPVRLSALAARIWELASNSPFTGLVLSPVTPLGSCQSVAPVDQNRIVSTARTSEVVSDPTNVLALEAAVRRRTGPGPVHLAACHRVLRAQQFDDPDAHAHFELFALMSSARDTGSARTEADLLVTHLRFWQRVLVDLLGPGWGHFGYTVIGSPTMRDRIADTVRPRLPSVALEQDPERRQGIGYYRTTAFKIMASDGEQGLEIGDGGFIDWTARLMADAKERGLISCVSTDRLLSLLPDQRRPPPSRPPSMSKIDPP